MNEPTECSRCGAKPPEAELRTCSYCTKGICLKCEVLLASRPFCSAACGEFYFRGDEDEHEGDE